MMWLISLSSLRSNVLLPFVSAKTIWPAEGALNTVLALAPTLSAPDLTITYAYDLVSRAVCPAAGLSSLVQSRPGPYSFS